MNVLASIAPGHQTWPADKVERWPIETGCSEQRQCSAGAPQLRPEPHRHFGRATAFNLFP
jgi:hypothetical protein